MPEHAGVDAEPVRLWATVLTLTGLLTAAGAVAAYATGDGFYAEPRRSDWG